MNVGAPGSASGVDQGVVHEDLATDDEPSADGDFDEFTGGVSGADFSGELAAEGEAFVFVLEFPIYKKSFSAEPSVLDTDLVAFVGDVPAFHGIWWVVTRRDYRG